MDFLDPKKQRQQAILLLVGYVLIGVALLLVTIILYTISYKGIGVGKNGQVVQNGLLFVASTPSGATIAIPGTDVNDQTNARLSLQSGSYKLKLTKDGYRPWQQAFTLDGASVLRLDYAFLFPTKLQPTKVHDYTAAPGLATQSPDRRWLVVQQPGSDTTFDVYDLKNTKAAPTTIKLPDTVITSGGSQTYTAVDWANDNQHVLLKHAYDNGKSEFIMLDRTAADKSVNLTTTFNTHATAITLNNKKYDQYYLYDSATQVLQSATLSNTTPTTVLEHVLNYKSYGTDMLLYATTASAPDGKVSIDLRQADKTYHLRTVAANTTYLLDLTQYNGSWFMVVGASSENKVYIYKNPMSQLDRSKVLVPIYILKTVSPTYVSFSPNTRFIMDENGSQFAVYDAEQDTGFQYDTKASLDAPQPNASWMDGDRLTYVSGGKLVVFDFDHGNQQTLMAADPNYLPFFSQDYKFVDTFAPTSGDDAQRRTLSMTPLLTPADQ